MMVKEDENMTFEYMVQKGDTLHRIARRFATNITAIASANPQLTSIGYIVPGQILQIPVRITNKYVIQAGDTFYELSRRFNINLNDLVSANPGVNPRRLLIGQTIVLPVGKGIRIVNTTIEYGYMELLDDLRELQQTYPFIEVRNIGKSVMGKDIPAVRIGTGDKEIHYNGSFHANEWITTPLLMKFIEDYALSYSTNNILRGTNISELYEMTTLWIVPMVNPDGVELVQEGITPQHPYYESLLEWNYGSFDFSQWKANIRGVDLNDQFPAGWQIERERRSPSGPAPRDYVGPAPLSEPEAEAMADFTLSHDFQLVMAFHTQGEVIFWNYRDLEPPYAEDIANRLGSVSFYQPVKLTGSDAGYKDWFIQEFRRPGFTIEAGLGNNPLPISDFPAIYDRVVMIMLEGLKV
jgi:g-D-glutamyl-meso-diaminopimelate peptidase